MGHNLQSIASGYDFQSGKHYNYSECSICGVKTRSYIHGDFEDMHSAERGMSYVPCTTLNGDMANEFNETYMYDEDDDRF